MKLVFLALLFSMTAAFAGSQRIERDGTVYYVYVTAPSRIDLFWKDPAGKHYGQFSALQKALSADSRRIEFMMNGGIFADEGVPCGLLVIDGKVLHPLNEADGIGNFFLKPNGVFYVDESGAHVVSTSEYAQRKPAPRLAIQSGPLLLNRDQIHPAFQKNSVHYLHRNGVGIRKDGQVIFAITEFGQKRYPNLYEFAEFFRSQGCENALFLDGDISRMEIDPGPLEPGNFFGTIFAVAPKKD